MKRIILTLLVILMAIPAMADSNDRRVVQSVLTSTKSTTIAVSTTSTVYTHSFPIAGGTTSENISVMYQMSPATGDTAIYFQQSYQAPTTEGSDDATYLTTQVISSSTAGSTQWKMATIDTVDMIYARFKIVGQGSNPATTTLSIKVGIK